MRRFSIPLIVGSLLAALLVAPAAATTPTVEIAVDRFGGFAEGGYGIVRGTATCSPELGGATVDIGLRQKQGSTQIEGFETFGVICDGTEQHWEIGVRSNRVDRFGNYLFRGGPASVSLFVSTPEFEMSFAGSTTLRGPAQ